MKKLLIPVVAITALLLATGCDINKRMTDTKDSLDRRTDSPLTSDEVRTSAASSEISTVIPASSTTNYGVSEGSAATGNAKFKNTAQPVIIGSDVAQFIEDSDYDFLERQAMEDVDYRPYPTEKYESEEERLNRLEKENGIFYGYPSATGASGSPGSYELTK